MTSYSLEINETVLPANFRNKIVASEEHFILIRTNLNSLEDMKLWVTTFGRQTDTKWIVRGSRPNGQQMLCSKWYVCHQNGFNKVFTNNNSRLFSKIISCPAKIHVKIKLSTSYTRRRDPYVKDGLCAVIRVWKNHSHRLITPNLQHFPEQNSSKSPSSTKSHDKKFNSKLPLPHEKNLEGNGFEVDVASDCYLSQNDIVQLSHNLFIVPSERNRNNTYSVDTEIGSCSCPDGRYDRFCKHQRAVYRYFRIRAENLTKTAADKCYNSTESALEDDYCIIDNSSNFIVDSVTNNNNDVSQLETNSLLTNKEGSSRSRHTAENVESEVEDEVTVGTQTKSNKRDTIDSKVLSVTKLIVQKVLTYKSFSTVNHLKIFEQKLSEVNSKEDLENFLSSDSSCSLSKRKKGFGMTLRSLPNKKHSSKRDTSVSYVQTGKKK